MNGAVNPHGVLLVKPGTATKIDVTALSPPRGRHMREILLVSPSNLGDPDPNEITRFVDLNEAIDLIGNGDVPESVTGETRINPIKLLDCMQHPSKDDDVAGAYLLAHLRVGNPTQAKWGFENATANVIFDMFSVDYGLKVNDIEMRFENSTIVPEGVNAYIRKGSYSRGYTNLGRGIRVYYVGSSSGCDLNITVNTSDEAITLTTSGLDAGYTGLNIDLTDLVTVAGLVELINQNADYVAEIDPYCDPQMPVKHLDPVTGKDIKYVENTSSAAPTADTITDVGAFVAGALVGRWVNPNSTDGSTVRCRVVSNTADTLTFDSACPDLTTITASGKKYELLGYSANAIQGSILWTINREESQKVILQKNSGAVGTHYDRPAEIPYTAPNVSSGTYPAITANDWVDALEKVDKLWKKNGIIFPGTYSQSVHQLFVNYAKEKKEVNARDVRIFSGGDVGMTHADRKTASRNLNSTLSTYCVVGPKLWNESGEEESFPAMYFAAQCAGMHAANGIFDPITANTVNCIGVEERLNDREEKELIQSGATVLSVDEDDTDGSTGYIVLLGLTTYTSENKRMLQLLYSMSAVEYINQRIKQACWPLFYGERIHQDRAQIIESQARSILVELATPGPQQLLMADPSDPIAKPAYRKPIFTLVKGVGKITWSGHIADEGTHLFINGQVGFQELTV